MYRFSYLSNKELNLSNLQIAMINYVCSRQDKCAFVLRIEDLKSKENGQNLLDLLQKFGIKWDYLYYQSKNLKFHQQLASKLLADKKAFLCFCDDDNKKDENYQGHCDSLNDSEVINNPNPASVRIRIKKDFAIKDFDFVDKIQGKITAKNLFAFKILEKNKLPSQSFAGACDDMLEGITCVIRSKNHLYDTCKENLIRKELGFKEEISYAHLPELKDENLKEVSVLRLLEKYSPEAIINYIFSLNDDNLKDIFSLEDAINIFDLNKISKDQVKFNEEKLAQIDANYKIKKENK